jgi:hypothetical protein
MATSKSGRLIAPIHRLQRAVLAGPVRALSNDEREHISWPDLIRRLADRREEHLQVIGGGQHLIKRWLDSSAYPPVLPLT